MAKKSPVGFKISVEEMREKAFKCLEAQNSEKGSELVIGLFPEHLFAICNSLEDAGVEFIGDADATEDESQLSFGFDENDSDDDNSNLN